MSSKEFQSLHDVYEGIDECHKMTYVLQFLWRDLTSNFDVIGPSFTLSSTMEAQHLYSMVTKTMLVFHKYGFAIRCLLCDGASSNLALLKTLCCYTEGESIDSPWFISPLDGKNVYLVICPSHQVWCMYTYGFLL